MISPMKTAPHDTALASGKNFAPERATAAPAPARRPALHPNVLLVRWELAVRAADWSSALALAKALIAALPAEPIGWLYHALAQQQVRQLPEARETLLAAARKFPTDWRIAYNLACCAAQWGDVAGAWNWLERAVELGDAAVIRSLAAEEPSLKQLWERSALPEPDLPHPAAAHGAEAGSASFAA
jgi:Flp pilus assembly protein TadD